MGAVSKGLERETFNTRIVVDKTEYITPTHSVDCYKNRVALEVEWNNKDSFYDRDLNNFRLLFDLRAIEVGVIITRYSELQEIFANLGRGPSYRASTTHLSKLLPRIDGGGGGGCLIVVFGIRKGNYVDDRQQIIAELCERPEVFYNPRRSTMALHQSHRENAPPNTDDSPSIRR